MPTASNNRRRESSVGTPLDFHKVRRGYRRVVKDTGLTPEYWTPRKMRHSFVFLLSNAGVSLEDIARLGGRSGTAATESVSRKQIRLIIEQAATAMERIFPAAS